MAETLPWNYRPPQPPSAEEEVPKHQSRKKDTKRWCKGKVGHPHEPKWEGDSFSSTLICQRCRKHLDFYFGWLGERKKWVAPVIGSSEPLKRKEK